MTLPLLHRFLSNHLARARIDARLGRPVRDADGDRAARHAAAGEYGLPVAPERGGKLVAISTSMV